jgi:hypothetical protein
MLLFVGCRRDRAGIDPKQHPGEPQSIDRLLPGELAEGKQRALGLALPRDMRLERLFDDSAEARGRVPAQALAEYVRKRVDAPNVQLGLARTVFPRAHPSGAPAERLVRIEIFQDLDATVLLLRDITPPAVPSGLSEDERWRKAGVLPGKPFDPNAL